MKIPIASMTVDELRVLVAGLPIYNSANAAAARELAMRLVEEISRLRSLEEQRCKTTWHDHMPEQLPDRLELEELTQMMRKPNG